MKKSLFFSISLLISVVSLAQFNLRGGGGTLPVVITTASNNFNTVQLGNLSGRLLSPADLNISGSPFFTTDFKSATVILKNGYKAVKVPVKFNVYNNEMIFRNDKKEELALDNLKYVVYYDDEDDSTQVRVFTSGYPATTGITSSTIFELLGGGVNYHLLKYHTQKLEPQKTMGYHHLKEFVNYTDYYVYTPAGKLIKIKLNGGSVMQSLEGMEAKAEKIIETEKLSMKKEKDVAALFNALDNLK